MSENILVGSCDAALLEEGLSSSVKVDRWPLWRPRESLSSLWLARMAANKFGRGRHGGQHVCRPSTHKRCHIGARRSGRHGGHAARVMRPPQALVRRCSKLPTPLSHAFRTHACLAGPLKATRPGSPKHILHGHPLAHCRLRVPRS
jgi:hypothetical protein